MIVIIFILNNDCLVHGMHLIVFQFFCEERNKTKSDLEMELNAAHFVQRIKMT